MADDLKSLDSCSCKTEDWLPGARTKTLPITPPGPTGVPHWSASREDADATVGRRLKNNQAQVNGHRVVRLEVQKHILWQEKRRESHSEAGRQAGRADRSAKRYPDLPSVISLQREVRLISQLWEETVLELNGMSFHTKKKKKHNKIPVKLVTKIHRAHAHTE